MSERDYLIQQGLRYGPKRNHLNHYEGYGVQPRHLDPTNSAHMAWLDTYGSQSAYNYFTEDQAQWCLDRKFAAWKQECRMKDPKYRFWVYLRSPFKYMAIGRWVGFWATQLVLWAFFNRYPGGYLTPLIIQLLIGAAWAFFGAKKYAKQLEETITNDRAATHRLGQLQEYTDDKGNFAHRHPGEDYRGAGGWS